MTEEDVRREKSEEQEDSEKSKKSVKTLEGKYYRKCKVINFC